MKKIIVTLGITVLALLASDVQAFPLFDDKNNIEEPIFEPPYAKWGKLAIQETHKKYPTAEIVDYLHVGRQSISATTSQETFKLWLKQGGREFGVYIKIRFDTRTEAVQSVTFEETDR
ncbi:YqzG/YhdC family protein [Ammoniphilus sp. 3BR4]|uniref:YqzG/YhdC family protein n=1 Tax=Ammoniphilus sp. 3BR4 TaxID=3158265 RepID=UPI003466B1F7